MEYDAFLQWEIRTKDKDGFPQNEKKEIPVYVKEKSITRAEFYAAMRDGIKVSRIFEVRREDWEESRHMVNGKPVYATAVFVEDAAYDILRSYATDKSMVEITCT